MAVWYPGEGFAEALAKVLAGDAEPGGRLPISIAECDADYPGLNIQPDATGKLFYSDATRIGYRGIIAAGKSARYPFGAGYGYANFAWSDAQCEKGGVSVLVSNTSDRAGSDVVQVYRDEPEATLVGFAKVLLDPGASKRVTIALPRRRFMYWDDQHAEWMPIGKTTQVRLARHAEDIGMALELEITKLPPGGL